MMCESAGARLLPNTAGCRSVREAVTTAKLARELFGTARAAVGTAASGASFIL